MTTYRGTDTVKPGMYFNLRQFSFAAVDEPKPLPGGPEDVYRRVPLLLLFAVAPLLGLAYVVFLPFMGFAMVGYLVGGKAAHVAADTTRAAARVLKPGWEPSLAFLSRTKTAKTVPTRTDEWADEVEKKLSETDEQK